MDEYCVILANHAMSGEIQRAKLLLSSPAASTMPTEGREILNCCFGLALGNIQDSLAKLKTIKQVSMQPVVDLVEMLYLQSCAIKEGDKIDVLHQNIELEVANLSQHALLVSFVCCATFDIRVYRQIFEQTFNQSETAAAMIMISELLGKQNQGLIEKLTPHIQEQTAMGVYAGVVKKCVEKPDQLRATFSPVRMKCQLFGASQHDQMQLLDFPLNDRFQLLNHVNQARAGVSCSEYIKKNFQNPLYQLLMNLNLANFTSDSEAIVSIQQYLDTLLPKVIGKPYLPSQREHYISILTQIARSYPTVSCLKCISEFILNNLEIHKFKQLSLLFVYFQGLMAILTSNTAQVNKTLEKFNEIYHTGDTQLQGIEGFILKTDDIFILLQAVVGKFTEVKQQLTDYVRDEDDDNFPLLKAATECFEKGSTIEHLLEGIANYGRKTHKPRIIGYNTQVLDISYGYLIPDQLALAVVCQFLNDKLEKTQTMETVLLQQARVGIELAYSYSIGSKNVRYCSLLILQNLQLFDIMLKEISELSSFASSENCIAISTSELIAAASAAAQLFKQNDATTYAGQALIIDPAVEKSPEYNNVVSKILTAKGKYSEAAQKLQTVLSDKAKLKGEAFSNKELAPLRIHIALLKIRGGDLDGFETFRQLQNFFPPVSQVISVDLNEQSSEYIAMHCAVEKARAILYILRQAGVFNALQKQEQQQSSFEQLISENSILFFESPQLAEKMMESISTTFAQGSSVVGAKYIGALYGPCPISTQNDIFFVQQENKSNEQYQKYCNVQKFNIQTVMQLLKPYLQFSLDATEMLSQVHYVLLNDKVGYVQCFNQLTLAVPSTSRLAALASAHLSVGNAKQAQEMYQRAINTAQVVIKQTKLPEYIETLMVVFLNILRSRALSRCHRFLESEQLLKSLLNGQQLQSPPSGADQTTRMNCEARQITFAIVCFEYMKLQTKMRQYTILAQLSDDIVAQCVDQFKLPLSGSSSANVPLPVVALAVYATRAKAELIRMGQLTGDRLELLQRCAFWADGNISLKTQRALPAKLELSMKMCGNVFSTTQSKPNVENLGSREQVGVRGVVISAEIKVELAELYRDLAKIDAKILSGDQPYTANPDSSAQMATAFDYAKQSLRCKSARGLMVCAAYQLVIQNDLEKAREYAVEALNIESYNAKIQELISSINHKMNFGTTEDEESEKANTPFEDATRLLKTGLNVDRVQALNSFLLNSCLVHDMTVVTDCLFSNRAEHEQVNSTAMLGAEFASLKELNERSDKQVLSAYDGYFYLGRGLLSVKMGRIQSGFKDLMAAVNSQTLNDTYRARALYLLGTIYINPARAPLYGFTSCLQGKQKSAIGMQKQATGQQDNVNFIEDQVQQVDNEDVVVPDTDVLNQRDEDLNEANQILGTIDQLEQKQVPEAEQLGEMLRALLRVGQYQQAKDRIARVMQDEGTKARTKLQQLEEVKKEAEARMTESSEDLHQIITETDKSAPNYVCLLYVLGVLYAQLKNETKSRSCFTTGSKQISSIKELGQSAVSSEAQLWLDVDASVQCNLALADQYVTLGKITNALKALDSVASLDKIQAVSYELYGLCMEKESAFDDAVSYYESAWLLSKGSPSVAYRLAYNYMKANKYQDAVLMCQAALSEWPSFNKLRKEVLYKAEAMLRTKKDVK